MGFFDSVPEPDWPDDEEDDDALELPEWFGPPSGVLGATVAVRGLVARSENVVVALTGGVAYPSGVRLSLRVVVRRGDWSRDRWEDATHAVFEDGPGPSRRRGQALAVGVELADGSRATTASWRWPGEGEPPPQPPVLTHAGGGGGMSSGRTLESDHDLWLWPLPPGDRFDLVVAWPALDLGDHRLTLDAVAVREAAALAEPYWPESS